MSPSARLLSACRAVCPAVDAHMMLADVRAAGLRISAEGEGHGAAEALAAHDRAMVRARAKFAATHRGNAAAAGLALNIAAWTAGGMLDSSHLALIPEARELLRRCLAEAVVVQDLAPRGVRVLAVEDLGAVVTVAAAVLDAADQDFTCWHACTLAAGQVRKRAGLAAAAMALSWPEVEQAAARRVAA